jgi:hypothetical protein
MGTSQVKEKLEPTNVVATSLPYGQRDEYPISEEIYREKIPTFVAANLERLYGNVYCTLTRIAAYETLSNVNTYVRRSGNAITDIILFRFRGSDISVVNQQVRFSSDQIRVFCQAVFKEFPRAQAVRFYAIDTQLEDLAYPYKQTAALEENIITFPVNREAYLQSLSGKFRSRIHAAEKKLKNDYPACSVNHFAREEITPEIINDLLELAKSRMVSKGKEPYSESINREALEKTLKEYGHIVTITIDDKVCAGSMSASVGKRHFHFMAAHDPAYDKYILGNQIWLIAILHALDLQGEEVWLMGGFSEHKAKFLAKTHIFSSVIVYRSRLSEVLDWTAMSDHWIKRPKVVLKAIVRVIVNARGTASRKKSPIQGSEKI